MVVVDLTTHTKRGAKETFVSLSLFHFGPCKLLYMPLMPPPKIPLPHTLNSWASPKYMFALWSPCLELLYILTSPPIEYYKCMLCKLCTRFTMILFIPISVCYYTLRSRNTITSCSRFHFFTNGSSIGCLNITEHKQPCMVEYYILVKSL